MLPTFVIGLREGLEAALIVGIIAAFLRKQGRGDLLRWVFVGVGTAIALCVGVGVALDILSRDLPQRQQEGLETVVGALAIAMVTYMVVWMRRHSRELKGSLEGAAASALNTGTERAARALVLMAFLAVLREGFETVVFLLAAFNETGSGASPVAGALIGIAVAVVLGWGIYRGGVSLNLAKFFRITGLVLVLVAAGLVMNAFHTAHEAGWLNVGQGSTFDMSWLVRTGTVRASLLTGILGLQPRPVVIELAGWLVYLLPITAYVAWPQGKQIAPRRIAVASTAIALLAAIAAASLIIASPAKPATRPVTSSGGATLQVVSPVSGRVTVQMPTGSPAGPDEDVVLTRLDGARTVRDGVPVVRYILPAELLAPPASQRLSAAAIAGLNGGRLPLGVKASGQKIRVTYRAERSVIVDIAAGQSSRVLTATWLRQVTAQADTSFGGIQLNRSGLSTRTSLPPATVAAAMTAARRDLSTLDRREDLREGAAWLAALAGALLIGAAGAAGVSRRRSTRPPTPAVDGAATPLIQREVSLT